MSQRLKLQKLLADKKKKKAQSELTASNSQSTSGRKIQLSALQQSMQKQLNGAQFRLINEQLYTMQSTNALQLMKQDPSLFEAYHVGFRSQVEAWPVNPLTAMIEYAASLPPGSIIVDMGCGDAVLQQTLNFSHPLLTVHSFDLVSVNSRVTACDMKDVPLQSSVADCVVFCLALMGLNFIEFVAEAERVLKVGGVMKIAEVESRFVEVGEFVLAIEGVGFRLVDKNVKQKMFYSFTFQKGERVEKKRLKKRSKKQQESSEEEEEEEEEKKSTKKQKHEPGLLLKPCIYKRR